MIKSDLGKIIKSCEYSTGSVYVADMKNNMWAVVAVNDNNIIASRSFAYTDTTKKIVWKSCNKYYNEMKKCFFKQNLDMIQFLEDL